MPIFTRRQLFAAVLFVASTFVLALQLINPSPVMVSVGDSGANVAELGTYFGYRDVGVIAVAAALLGASGTYLLTASPAGEATDTATGVATSSDQSDAGGQSGDIAPSDELLEARRQEWEETADRLANKEEDVYETVLDADGVLAQSEIVAETDLSKASVSRALDSLEAKDLVERKRRGMGNMVILL